MFAAIVRFRFVVIVATVVVTCLFAAELPKLQLDPDTEAYVPERHPIRVYWAEAKERFGIGREILVAVVTETPDGIFTVERLNAIAELDEAIKNVDGVVEADVSSIADSDAMVGTEEGLEVEPLMEAPVETQAQADAIRAKAYDNPVYLDRLISRDGSIATVIVKTHHNVDVEETEIYRRIAAEVARHDIAGARILTAGSPAVEYVYGRQMTADLNRLIPLATFVVVITLFACFPTISLRRLCLRAVLFAAAASAFAWTHGFPGGWLGGAAASMGGAMLTTRGVFLPCVVVTVSVIWTWGLQAALGLPIYIAGTLVPPLLLAIGCADGIHVLERYFDLAAKSGGDANRRASVVIDTMEELWRPVVLTSITTAIGFGSLMLGRMTVYRVFGFTTAFGILVAMLVSLTLIPALLAVLPLPTDRRRGASEGRLGAILARWAEWIEGHRRATLAVSLSLIAFFAYSSRLLYVDYSWVESLAPDTEVLAADRVLRTRHGGTMPMNLIIRAPVSNGIKDPVLLQAMDTVLTELAADPEVGDTRSIAEYVARMNQAMNEDRPEELRIPDTRDLVAQYLLVYSMSGDPGEFDDVVDYDYSAANATVLLRTDRLRSVGRLVERAETLLDRHVRPLGATAAITGAAQIQYTVLGMILVSQIYSLATAACLVFVFMWLLFRSARVAVICMIPAVVTGIANFGGMAAMGLPLGPDKAMVSAIALGIGIDYSIHLMARFVRVRGAGCTVYAAIVDAVRTTGRAVLFNALVVVAGFLVLGFSQSPSNATFGVLIATNMAVACLAALVIVPVALTVAARVDAAKSARTPVSIGGRPLRARTLRLLGLSDRDRAA